MKEQGGRREVGGGIEREVGSGEKVSTCIHFIQVAGVLQFTQMRWLILLCSGCSQLRDVPPNPYTMGRHG